MMWRSNQTAVPAIVCEVNLEHFGQGLTNLGDYSRALVVFRLRGTVVGQAWVPVRDGTIAADILRQHLPALAWSSWQQIMHAKRQPTSDPLVASVVVCTRDRTEDLSRCLPGLQRLSALGHEVIVIDSCPSDSRTAELVANYPSIRYIHEPRPGAGIARNRGLLAATKEFIAFTDDDAQVDAEWLPSLLRNFDDPLVAIVTGITMPLELETYAQIWFEENHGFGRGFVRKSFDATTIEPLAAGLVGASVNMAVRRSVLQHIGLFDEALGPGTPAGSGEDHEFYFRTLTRGYRIVYDPTALVWHRHRREWDALRRTIYGYGVGVFAWWTRAFLAESEWTLLKIAPSWFWQHHLRNLKNAALRRPGSIPLDLALAEFRGALAGPGAYLRSRQRLRELSSLVPIKSERLSVRQGLPTLAIEQTKLSVAEVLEVDLPTPRVVDQLPTSIADIAEEQ